MAGNVLVNIMDNTFLDPFIEGSWMTKHNGKYYLQYGAPGTEFSGYADGVVVGDNPLGSISRHNPIPFLISPVVLQEAQDMALLSRITGITTGIYATMIISVKNSFERRLGIWPAGFDKDDVMYMQYRIWRLSTLSCLIANDDDP